MVSLFWFSSCRWEDASSRAQVSVSTSGLLFNSLSRPLLSFFFLLFSSPFLFHLVAPARAPRRLRVKRETICSSFDVSNFKYPEIKRRCSSRQPADSLPPSPRSSICELPFLLGAEKSKSPGAHRVIKDFCNVTSWPRRGVGGGGERSILIHIYIYFKERTQQEPCDNRRQKSRPEIHPL